MHDEEHVSRLAIIDTVARYTRAGDTGRSAELAALFAEDGVFEMNGGVQARGRAAIEAQIEHVKEQFASAGSDFFPARHHVSSLVIDFEGPDHARGRSHFLLVSRHGPDHWGIYRDRYVRDGLRWLFSERAAIAEGAVPQSPVAHLLDVTTLSDESRHRR